MTRPAGVVDGLLADRYRLAERLAAGATGEVWRAQDLLLDRPVAVKTLRPELVGDEEFRTRFRAEARHAARLSHPGVASVYDFGELPDRAWIVLELVEGEALSGVLRREVRLSPDRTLDVVAQTAAALQVAHDQGVVHRDVKPGNLLVRLDGTVKVTDFGIASAVDAAPLTRTGQVVGTAAYLSPEQAAGGSGTPASDVYALGVVAYECLVGVRPFVGDSAVAVAVAHLQAPPPPLPDDVPGPVRALVARMLAKDPADRPASAADVAREASQLRTTGAVGTTTQPLAVLDPYPLGERGHGVSARPGPLRPDGRSRTLTSARTQRRAVRATAVVLTLLAGALGLRGALVDATAEQASPPPVVPAPASEPDAVQVAPAPQAPPAAEPGDGGGTGNGGGNGKGGDQGKGGGKDRGKSEDGPVSGKGKGGGS